MMKLLVSYEGSRWLDQSLMYPGRYLETYVLFCGVWLLQSRVLLEET